MIRHLDIFTNERRLQHQSSLNLLKETRLGIEGAFWLRKLLQNSGKEPATAAIGGIPIGLRGAIEKELELLKSFGIIPFFVFNGLSVIRKDKPFSTEDTRPNKRAQAWDAYEKGKHDQAYNTWASSNSIHQPDLLYFVFNVLKENDVEFMRAPYSAWGQLVYLERHPKGFIHAIYGGSELLMYDVEKVIVNLDLEKGTYNWLSKKTILNDLAISDEQFLDVCILAGFEYCGTFPPLNTEFSSFTFKSVHDLIKQYKTGFNAVQNYADHAGVIKQNYMDIFCRTRCAIKYHLVLTDEGRVEPLNAENAPSDIHEFIGYRLPDEIYYYLSKGLMSPQVINTLISGVLIENPPLCNGETQEYRRFLNELLELRAQAMGLLTQPLHQFYQSRKVVSLYWFEPNVEHILNHNPSVHEILSTWNVLERGLEDERKTQKTSNIDFVFCLRATATDDQAAKTIMPKNNDKLIDSKEEILANVQWELLQLRKFLTSSHTHTPWGVAFKKALGSSKSNSSHQEQLFSALELIRFGYLSGNPYSRSYSGSPTVGTEEERKHILLISRTLSMVSPNYQGIPWAGPINRELLAFNSFVKALNRSLRNLCEMLTLSTFLNRDCLNERGDYLDIALSLPFVQDVNTGLGIIVKTYLENIVTLSIEKDNKISDFHINETLKKLEEMFTACINVKSDLSDGFSFWDEVIVAVKNLKSSGDISNDLASQFLNANQWLSARRF
ncbi:2066_t:CDS:10 [Ambispora gerdemannii]|uniref:2066_t:CDS:1 n=1 Tax=Ambispora gerdemannii TaxID=144530 RepID=A0A9N8WD38_9GLOM|nr:2066_t:CDS:10 [Ambispora gerdemannii]